MEALQILTMFTLRFHAKSVKMLSCKHCKISIKISIRRSKSPVCPKNLIRLLFMRTIKFSKITKMLLKTVKWMSSLRLGLSYLNLWIKQRSCWKAKMKKHLKWVALSVNSLNEKQFKTSIEIFISQSKTTKTGL